MSRSSEEQDARIALLQEYGSNARNWYTVLLGLAIVLFTAVQAKDDLLKLSIGKFSLWPVSLAVIFSQTVYSIIRAAVSVKLARFVVRIERPLNVTYGNYLEELDDKVRKKLKEKRFWKLHHWKIGLGLGDSLLWWLRWTAVVSLATWLVLVCGRF
jgi:hypothetical protein